MRIGFGAPVSGAWATPANLASFTAQAEAAGYASLWTFQRLIVPEGSAMEPVYHSVLDPMVALGYAAASTSRIRLGGGAPRALERAGRLADGWVTSSRADLSRIGDGIKRVKAAAQQAGRNPAAIRIICRGVVRWGAPVTVPEGGGRLLLSGSFDDIRGDTQWLAGQGVTEIFYDLNWDPLGGSPPADPLRATPPAPELPDPPAPRPPPPC